ncbi:pilus assembly protein [Altererythrobacter xixiisoli]|uniref:Pilus assembly protein n=2 Tax=Croceibacterium xixiisoli TaxID=1476466 RepID=A0A6I4TXS8_9SPHN|nr:pilus assembly protein [Croceibacterium xixiisoli]
MLDRCRKTSAALARDTSGATIVEFGFVAPIFVIMLLGIFELGHVVMAQATLQGAVQQAARDTTLETGLGNYQAIDDHVEAMLKTTIPNAEVSFDRRNYHTFSDVGRPEDYVDANRNGVYDPNECFTDINNNGQWDADMGREGIGGADDVVFYTVTVAYDRLFPIGNFLGWSDTNTMSSSTVLRNQPYGSQSERAGKQICRGN